MDPSMMSGMMNMLNNPDMINSMTSMMKNPEMQKMMSDPNIMKQALNMMNGDLNFNNETNDTSSETNDTNETNDSSETNDTNSTIEINDAKYSINQNIKLINLKNLDYNEKFGVINDYNSETKRYNVFINDLNKTIAVKEINIEST